MKGEREPDELDALLERTKGRNEESNDGYAALEAPAVHRKTRSVDFSCVPSILPGNKKVSRGRQHRKQMSSISELYDAIKNHDLAPIREDFSETARSLRMNFVEELDQMDKGENTFLEMSMTRSLSILPEPESMRDLAREAGVKGLEEKPKGKDDGPPLFQYFALFGAVVAISSNSTALHMLDGVTPALKLYWRMTASYVTLLPLAIVYFLKDGIPNLSLGQSFTFVAAAVSFAAQNCLFYTSMDYTTIGNAVIYANSQALLLIIGKAFVGEPIHAFESFGVLVAFSGAILCSWDSERSSKSVEEASGIYGDFLALLSAIAGVAYLTFAKAVRSEMSVTIFIFCVMLVGSLFVLLYIAADQEEPLEFDMDLYAGAFGWLDLRRLPYLIFLAVVCNMIGTMGFVRAMAHFDNVVIAVATLLEPLMASMIAFFFHVGLMPGPLGWVGNCLVVAGTLAVACPSTGKGDAMH